MQRNLQQISDRIDTLGQRFRAGDEDSQAAALLLAREGIDPSALMQEVRNSSFYAFHQHIYLVSLSLCVSKSPQVPFGV